jgi:ribosomal protein S6--L-glutamate ligase
VVGRRVFAVTKRFSPHSYQIHGHPIELDARTRDIVLKCGEVLGLYLYGVDLVRTDRGPCVVDVNYFPGYKGVPGAAKLIADYVYRYAVAGVRASSVLQGVV